MRPGDSIKDSTPFIETPMNAPQSLRYLSTLALVEGASLLALVGIAMPLKYYAGLPEAVRIVGTAHGALFLLATATLIQAMSRGHLPAAKGAGVFAASLVPFAGLWSHRMLARHIAARAD
jgi:integral membrane protein